MKYYIMYEDSLDYELTVITKNSSLETVIFIEEKINKQGYRLDDFEVISGTKLFLEAIHTPIKVLLAYGAFAQSVN